MQSLKIPFMKFFSLEEVRSVLPQVRVVMDKLMKARQTLDMMNTLEIHYPENVAPEMSFAKMNKEFHRFSYDFYCALEKLESLGCVVKDIDNGLVDFYSIVEGKEIFFCWKMGEADVLHWHDISQGYTGRMPIDALFLHH